MKRISITCCVRFALISVCICLSSLQVIAKDMDPQAETHLKALETAANTMNSAVNHVIGDWKGISTWSNPTSQTCSQTTLANLDSMIITWHKAATLTNRSNDLQGVTTASNTLDKKINAVNADIQSNIGADGYAKYLAKAKPLLVNANTAADTGKNCKENLTLVEEWQKPDTAEKIAKFGADITDDLYGKLPSLANCQTNMLPVDYPRHEQTIRNTLTSALPILKTQIPWYLSLTVKYGRLKNMSTAAAFQAHITRMDGKLQSIDSYLFGPVTAQPKALFPNLPEWSKVITWQAHEYATEMINDIRNAAGNVNNDPVLRAKFMKMQAFVSGITKGMLEPAPTITHLFAKDVLHKPQFMQAEIAMQNLKSGTDFLLTTGGALDCVLMGETGKTIQRPIRLFYYTNVPQLMKILNPNTAVLNPESLELEQKADTLRAKLDQAGADLAEKVHVVDMARTRALTIEEDIRLLEFKIARAEEEASEAKVLREELEELKKKTTKPEAVEQIEVKQVDAANDQQEAKTAKETAQSKLEELRVSKVTMDDDLGNARRELEKAQKETWTLRVQLEQLAAREMDAFAKSRQNSPIWFAPGCRIDPNPVHQVTIYGFEQGSTLMLRGQPDAVQQTADYIAQFDSPAPQARITLWTMQLNGDNKNQKANKAMLAIDRGLSDYRGNITLVQDLLRSCLNQEVSAAADVAKRAYDYQLDNRIARYYFYPPEIRASMGLDKGIPSMSKRAAMLYRSLLTARDYYHKAAETQRALYNTEYREEDTLRYRRTRRSLLTAARESFYTAMKDFETLSFVYTMYRVYLPPDSNTDILMSGIQMDLQQIDAKRKQLDALMQGITTDLRYNAFLGDETANVQPQQPQNQQTMSHTGIEQMLDNAIQQTENLLRITRGSEYEKPQRMSQQDSEEAAYLTQWTLPDPVHATTLGEMLFVLSLGEHTYRERVLQRFLQELGIFFAGSDSKNPGMVKFAQSLSQQIGMINTPIPRNIAGGDVLQYPYFPRTVLGSCASRVPAEVYDREMTPNQKEIFSAVQAQVRSSVAGEIRHLITQLANQSGQPDPGDPFVMEIRQRYLPLVGWLLDNTPVPSSTPSQIVILKQQYNELKAEVSTVDMQLILFADRIKEYANLMSQPIDMQVKAEYLHRIDILTIDSQSLVKTRGELVSNIASVESRLRALGQQPPTGISSSTLPRWSRLAIERLLPGVQFAGLDNLSVDQGIALDQAAWKIASLAYEANALSNTTPRVAAADDMIKRFIIVAEGDLEYFFFNPMLENLYKTIGKDVQLGVMQRESILATNRMVARIDPNANAAVELGTGINFLEQATQLTSLYQQYENLKGSTKSESTNQALTTGGATVAKLAGASDSGIFGTAGILSLLSAMNEQPRQPAGEVYAINSGNVFKVTPIFDPSGQALRFKFDFNSTVRVREPDGTTSPTVPRVERHSVNTEVQLTNLEIREISRFQVNTRVGTPEQRIGGIPFIKELPLIRDIPLLGYYVKKGDSKATSQESIIFAQTSIYPTVADIVALLVDAPMRKDYPEEPPAYLGMTVGQAIQPAD